MSGVEAISSSLVTILRQQAELFEIQQLMHFDWLNSVKIQLDVALQAAQPESGRNGFPKLVTLENDKTICQSMTDTSDIPSAFGCSDDSEVDSHTTYSIPFGEYSRSGGKMPKDAAPMQNYSIFQSIPGLSQSARAFRQQWLDMLSDRE